MDEQEYLDLDGYPTDAALDRIKEWDWHDVPGVFAFIRELWWQEGWGVSDTLRPEEYKVCHNDLFPDRKYIRFATGGWSGNESLIYALRENHIIWSCCWQLSASGGLHIFQFRNE